MIKTESRAVSVGGALSIVFDVVRRTWKIIPLTVALSFVISWQVAFMLMLSQIIHEVSHLMVARWCGVYEEGIVFLFTKGGALIQTEDASWKHRWRIALAGPVSGVVCAFVCWAFFSIFKAGVFLSATFWIATPVLFNVIPLGIGTDGKMTFQAISEVIRSKKKEDHSLTQIVIAILVFMATTVALAGISACSYHGLSRSSLLPLRFFF